MSSNGYSRRPSRDARRERLKHHVPSLYRPWVHLSSNVLVAFIAVVLLARIPDWQHTPWWAYSAIVVGLVAGNLVEYGLHRFPMHRRYKRLKRMFTQHTVQHHRFYTHTQMQAEERRDYFFVLFPVELGLLNLLAIAFVYALCRMVLGVAFASVLSITLIIYVLMLDGVHLMCHLPQRYFKKGILSWSPFVYLMRLHQRHHDPRAMREVNFNITFPLVDWWVGTLDDGRAREGSPRRKFWSRVLARTSV